MTQSTTVTAQPTPTSPIKNAPIEQGAALFSWEAVPGATLYRLQIAGDEHFKSLIADVEVEGATSLTLFETLPLSDASFFWRVRAGKDAWSAAESFRSVSDEQVPRTTEGAPHRMPPPSTQATGTPQPPQGDAIAPQYVYGVTSERTAMVAFLVMIATVILLTLAIMNALPG